MTPPNEVAQAGEAWVWLAVAAASLRLVPFRHVARWLGAVAPGEDGGSGVGVASTDALRAQAWACARAVNRAARRSPWRTTCLIRAMAGRAMLRRRGMPCTLYLGVAPGGAERRLRAHAWLSAGGEIILGGQEASAFRAIARFDRAVGKSG